MTTGSRIDQTKAMHLLEKVTVERTIDAFRNDQKVKSLGLPWPVTLAEKIALLCRPEVGKPIDYILSLSWSLHYVERAELLSLVRPVWCPPGCYYPWTLEQMFAEYRAGRFMLPEPNTVLKLEADMRVQFRESDFVLTAYRDLPYLPQGMRLEDGHNRVTAAWLAGVIPAMVKMYIGEAKLTARC